MKYCQYVKALWLSVNKSEEATVDAGVEARFAEGNVVGDLAMAQPSGVLRRISTAQ